MSNTATKTYYVGVIERAIAYYEVEAEDARTAAENWQDGEFSDRDDEALESEGPCSVREQQPDGTWRKVPPSEWEDAQDEEADSVALHELFEALRLAQSALNTAPRFRVGDTDSYKIAAVVDRAIAKATTA
jgi:hypothetical protein